jgi:glutaredoxin 3
MANVVMYTKANCPYCDWAKQLLNARHASFEEIRIDLIPEKQEEMVRLSGRRTVPQIFINDQAIGGFDDLSSLAKAGKLDELLA